MRGTFCLLMFLLYSCPLPVCLCFESGSRIKSLILLTAGGRNPSPERAEKYMRWNTLLSQYVAAFAAEHEHATTMAFSSHVVFSDIIKNPVKYGFQEDHARKFRGTVWVDHIHPTSKVHRVVADSIVSFLRAQLPYEPDLLERAEMTAPLA